MLFIIVVESHVPVEVAIAKQNYIMLLQCTR